MSKAENRVGPPADEIDGLYELIDRMAECKTAEDWSYVLSDYVTWGNDGNETKVGKRVAIFSLNAAVDCPNRWTDNCQVGGNECYAVVDEKRYDYVISYRRRSEYLWDCLDAETWADAFLAIVGRKHTDPPFYLKFNQSGDFRHNGDIIRAERIAKKLYDEAGIRTFTYSASDYLTWDLADHIVVNQSNDLRDYGVRRYRAVESYEDLSDNAVHCPYDRQKFEGIDRADRVKCGECVACITEDAPDVEVVK